MGIRWITAGMVLAIAGLAAPCGAGERPKVVREARTVESYSMARNKATRTLERHKQTINVAVYRPNDGQKHPAIVYLHGGGMSFADPLMDRFHFELASRGLVVLAPHYLLDGTGWPMWHETAIKTVDLAESLPSVDADRIGMSGLSMGGQIGLSTAARDKRIKAVGSYFTAWPGTLPGEPIADLPKVLLLNGTVDPIIPLDAALVLDGLLKDNHVPFERHIYQGQGHGFGGAAFNDGVVRVAEFFGGEGDNPVQAVGSPGPISGAQSARGSTGVAAGFDDGDASFAWEWEEAWWANVVTKNKPKRRPISSAATAPVSTRKLPGR
jgi:dienelactone hydrolase